ncbi:hypothetical protein QAD02_010293 [Eretmocerus hayati]|uniref:Uncharacterized protein n=1 Tax=Eretmocerus hayati TaxID=131215 RepID=A0ACC2NBV7_9HYME|nr:hypothetical protein QAD02_010293 [Eretmocerus hayati]
MGNLKIFPMLFVITGFFSGTSVSARRPPRASHIFQSDLYTSEPQALLYHVEIFILRELTINTSTFNKANLSHQQNDLTGANHISECGGVIIQRRSVLTAASCVYGLEPHQLVVRAGGDVVPPPDKLHHDRRLFRKVIRIVRHGDYQPNAHAHDFALLKLSGSFDLADNESFGVAHLPDGVNDHEDKWALVSGYEKSRSIESPTNLEQSHFKTLHTKIISNTDCEQLGVYNITYDSLCSQYTHFPGNYCGNIGDPLMYENEVVGILSSPAKCSNNTILLFTKISVHVRWIRETILNQDMPDMIVI